VTQPWWKEGVRFECTGRGCCCVTHGNNGFVYITPQDLERIAQKLELSVSAAARRYCHKDADGRLLLKDAPATQACIFLTSSGCEVYEARPTQCRTWPFWPENMTRAAWAKVAAFCPGVGSGRLWTADEIAIQLALQRESDR